jgi:hypothetical protein
MTATNSFTGSLSPIANGAGVSDTPQVQRAKLWAAKHAVIEQLKEKDPLNLSPPTEDDIIRRAINKAGLNMTLQRAKHLMGLAEEPTPVGPVIPSADGFSFV